MISLTKEIYTLVEVADLLGVTARTVQLWCRDDREDARLKSIRVGRNVTRIVREDLAEFIRRHYAVTPEPKARYRTKTPRGSAVSRRLRRERAKRDLQELGVK